MTTDTGLTSTARTPGSDPDGSRPTLVQPAAAGWTGRVRSAIKHLVLMTVAFLMLYPVLWMIAGSLRAQHQIFQAPRTVGPPSAVRELPRRM